MDLYGKDFIVSQEWSLEELQALLDLAAKMKRIATRRAGPACWRTRPS